MKIGIDASMLVYRGSGVATYTDNLIKNLLKYAPHHEYRIFYSSLRRPKSVSIQLQEIGALGAKIYSLRLPPKILNFFWNKHHLLPVEWYLGKVDIFLSSDYLRPPLMKSTRGVTTIHDLTWKLFPSLHTSDIIKAHARKLTKTIKYEDCIIADSKNTKKDLFKLYPQSKIKNHVEVIYPGIDDNIKEVTSKDKIKKTLNKYEVDYSTDYLLYVGAIEPRKNLDLAIKVFSQLIKQQKYQKFIFIIVGRAGWKNGKIFELIKELNLSKKVIFLGYVENQDLSTFYSAAKVTLYLSAYEGFGLPPLESAQCDTPTLLYSNSSLSELFPLSYPFAKKGNELETLINILENSKLNVKKYASSFSWKNYVKEFDRMITYEKK
jgi:glycosyltransferase involved in cell wall biosynthesis